MSIPDFSESVMASLKVSGQGIDGEELRIEAEGLLARCLCHEIDHLNGILFIDHLSSPSALIKNRIRTGQGRGLVRHARPLLGTPEFAVPALESPPGVRQKDARAVIAQPDRPRGAGIGCSRAR